MTPTLEDCLRLYGADVYRSAYRILRQSDQAEDVVQEVFLQALRRKPDWGGLRDPRRVLCWSALKTALSVRRSSLSRERREGAAPLGSDAPEPLRTLEQAEREIAVREACQDLPDDLRIPVELRFREELTLAEIGRLLGCAEPTVHGRLSRALEALRARLRSRGVAGVAVGLEELLRTSDSITVPAFISLGQFGTATAAGSSAAGSTLFPAAWWGLPSLIALGALLGAGWAALHDDAANPTTFSEPERPAVLSESGEDQETTGGATEVVIEATDVPPLETVGADEQESSREVLIRGRLVDGQGLPASEVPVLWVRDVRGLKFGDELGKSTTDERGNFECSIQWSVATGKVFCKVDHPEFSIYQSHLFKVGDEATLEVGELELHRHLESPPGDYELLIKAIVDGQPADGVHVRVFRDLKNQDGSSRRLLDESQKTDAQGQVRIHGDTIGAKWIVLDGRHAGYQWKGVERTLPVEGFHELTIDLEVGEVLQGTVRLVDGSIPISADIRVGQRFDVAKYDRDTGTFTCIGLDPGPHSVTVRCWGHSSAYWAAVSTDQPLEVELKRRDDVRDIGDHQAEIHLRVVDEQGEPVGFYPWDYELAVIAPADLANWDQDYLPNSLYGRSRMKQQQMEDTDETTSEIHAVDLSPGSYAVRILIRGRARTLTDVVTLTKGQIVDLGDVAIPSTNNCTVEVRDAAGNPVSNIPVMVTGWGPQSQMRIDALKAARNEGRSTLHWVDRKTGTDGQCVLDGRPSDLRLRVLVHPGDGPVVERVIEPEERDVVVHLE